MLSRCAKDRRVFFWEEPYFDADDIANGTPHLEVMREGSLLWVLRPHLPRTGSAAHMQHALLQQFMQQQGSTRFVRWYYTPMALKFTRDLRAEATVYDCMDELASFQGAPPELHSLEQELLLVADVVFAGGISLYEAKRKQAKNVYAFPSSIEVEHFAKAKSMTSDPADQAGIPYPRAGFFGVLDERFDLELMAEVARLRPETHFILLGPVVKIDPATLPQAANIHYLGAKSYTDLPAYLASWNVALLPFALNASTRFISPTKTPEYLAAGKPVVSTPIHDVVVEYGNKGLVAIADSPEAFASAIGEALLPQTDPWRAKVTHALAANSWDKTWASMWFEIHRLIHRSASFRVEEPVANYRSLSVVHPQIKFASSDLRSRSIRPVRSERYDYLVVGAGFAGSVLAERLANGMGQRVLLIDKRDHVGGNTFDFYDESGILVHRYGPHIFHTNSADVVDYLSRFTEWRPYEHRVLASVDGQLLPIPINLDTINRLYGLSLDAEGMKHFLAQRSIAAPSIRTSEDIVVSRIGRELYEKFFRNYTRKQWGLDPSELDASVAGRIPVRFDRDDRYFTDTFQAMPLHGFTRLFERMLDSANIKVRTGVNSSEVARAYPGVKTIFTGPVDEYFGYRFGPLPYRSLEFKHQSFDREQYQTAAVVNYPNDHAYTRVTEFKYLTGQQSNKTSVVFEYPRAEGDPYYPIPRPENAAVYAKYRDLAERQNGVHFVGRLATYKYYNMDQVVAQALTTYRRIAAQAGTEITAPQTSRIALGS